MKYINFIFFSFILFFHHLFAVINTDFIDPKNVHGVVNIAMSVGGTKIISGSVCSDGIIEMSPRIEWKKILEENKKYDAQSFVELICDEIEKNINSLKNKGIPLERIIQIGIAWPGPGDYENGILSATFLPGFKNYPFIEKAKESLKKRFAKDFKFNILFDALADAYGEMALNPSLKNWMYINIATGIACGIIKNGNALDSYCFSQDSGLNKSELKSDYVKSGLGQIGRHLILTNNKQWEYRPTSNGEIPQMSFGEIRFTDYIGGPGLAKRFVEYIELKDPNPDCFFEYKIDYLKNALANKDAKIIRLVLETIQTKAQENIFHVLEFISEVGKDIGKALKAFAQAYPQEIFYNKIIIGGGVAENIGKNILIADNNNDILIYNIIKASEIQNISRTTLDVKRELIAFCPHNITYDTKVLLFDLDDTLYDSPQLKKLYKESLYELYRIKNSLSKDEAKIIIENKRKELLLQNKPHGDRNVLEALDFSFDDINNFRETFIGDPSRYIEKTNDLNEKLAKLKKQYHLILATNNLKNKTIAILKKLNMENIFEKIYTQDETNLHKPDKRLFELIQEDMQVPFDQIVSIGDSLSADIEPASELGMQVLHVKNSADLYSKIDILLFSK